MTSKISEIQQYYPEMHRKLWPKAPTIEGALGQQTRKFVETKQQMYNKIEELYCDASIFVIRFFIVYLLEKNAN